MAFRGELLARDFLPFVLIELRQVCVTLNAGLHPSEVKTLRLLQFVGIESCAPNDKCFVNA